MHRALLATALLFGALVTWVDSSPGWDDTGITLGTILLVSVILGALGPRRPWLWAVAVGAWIPLVEIPRGHGWAPLAALGIAGVGAYAGSLGRKIVGPATGPG
ncbi:MAG TPA: hypothetical protein VJ997_12730 [Longimicrobiales bacterium]|nr:hypothetical protein [Longimicrobiales bacterium]